jgi:hypothetical protein
MTHECSLNRDATKTYIQVMQGDIWASAPSQTQKKLLVNKRREKDELLYKIKLCHIYKLLNPYGFGMKIWKPGSPRKVQHPTVHINFFFFFWGDMNPHNFCEEID